MTVTNLLKLGLKSVLEEAAKDMPQAMPAEQVPNYLRGKGVKQEELEFSGVGAMLPKEGKVSPEQMQDYVTQRRDIQRVDSRSITGAPAARYASIIPKSGFSGNPSYREDVFSFSSLNDPGPLTQSEHFTTSDYIGHVRRYDEYKGDKRRRVVVEVQSDTVAALRDKKTAGGFVYAPGKQVLSRKEYADPDILSIISDPSGAELRRALGLIGKEKGTDLEVPDDTITDLLQDLAETVTTKGTGAAKQALLNSRDHLGNVAADHPYKKNMTQKLLERQVLMAQRDGVTEIAIPMTGPNVTTLVRGGNQALYNEDGIVVGELKKLAKANGWKVAVEEEATMHDPDLLVEITKAFANNPKRVGLQKLAKDPETFIKENLGVGKGRHYYFSDFRETVQIYAEEFGYQVPKLTPEQEKAFSWINSVSVDDLRVPKQRYEQETAAAAKTVLAWAETTLDAARKPQLNRTLVVDMADDVGTIKRPVKPFTLYSSPAAGAFAAYALLSAGANEAKVQKRLQEDGYDKEDIAQYISDAEVIRVGYENGITETDIRAFLDKDQVKVASAKVENPQPIAQPGSYWHKESDQEMPDPRLPTTQQQFAKEGQNLQAKRQRDAQLWARDALAKDELTMSELIGALRVVHPDQSFFTTQLLAIGGNEESARIAQEHAQNAQKHIIAAIKRETGIDAVWSDDADNYIDSEGNVLDDAFWDRMWTDVKNSDQSISWGITGAAAGAINVAKKTKNPYAIAAGGIVGGYMGSMGGGQIDYIKSVIKTGSDMNGQVMARRMLTEAELAALGEVAATAVIGTARAGKGAVKKVIGLIKGKDVDGAMQALAEFTHTTPQELEEIRAGVTRVVAMPDMSREEQTIAATILTRPGGEAVLEAAVSGKPSVGTAVVKGVHQRAKALLTATEALRDTNGAVKITSDLQNYRLDVQRNYEEVKNRAATSTKAGAYKFKFPETVLLPVLERTKGNIFDPTLRKKFVNKVKQVRALSSSRTFADLLEMRKIVNSMVNNSTLKNASGYADIKTALTAIDAEIDRGAAKAVDNPVQWLKDYREANRLYSDMKVLEQNVLYKALTTPGVTPEAAAKGLYMYATSMDSTFVDVMAKLPRQTRLATEGEIFKIVSDKYTVGVEGGMRATHFPAMAKELSQMTFTSPEARKLQLAVLKLSEVFINDVPLSQVSGSIQVPQFQSYLTADPLTRAKFALASGVFKKIKELTPGELQRNLSLVNILTEVLEKPMDAKLLDQLVKEAGDRVDVSQQVMALASAAARQTADKADIGAPKVKVFGSGKILSTKPVIGSTVEGKSIPMHRIATIEDARDFAAAEGVNPSDVKKVDELLRERGYLAVQLGTNKIRRID